MIITNCHTMMKNSYYSLPYELEDTYILPFGNFYFYKRFVVSEIHEGISLDESMAEMILELIDAHYGKMSIGYISHRINNYNVSKYVWAKMLKKQTHFASYATVPLPKETLWDKIIKHTTMSIKREKFDTLLEAASWVTSLNVLIKN